MNTHDSLIRWAESTLPFVTNWPSWEPSPTAPPLATEEQLKIIQETQNADEEKLNQLGLKISVLASAIQGIIRFPNLSNQHKIGTENNNGVIFYKKCMLCDEKKLDSLVYKIKNRKVDLSVTVSDLALHYMKCHDFCGFPETSSRIDLDNLVCVLYQEGCEKQLATEEQRKIIEETQNADEEKLNQLGLKISVLAGAVEGIIAFPNSSNQHKLRSGYSNTATSYMECLLCNEEKEDNFFYRITNRKINLSVTVSDLALHYLPSLTPKKHRVL